MKSIHQNSHFFVFFKKITILCLLSFLLTVSEAASTFIKSPFNDLTLDLTQSHSDFSFYLVGHAYGSYLKRDNMVFPAASLLANIDLFNEDPKAKLVVFLGDIIRNPTHLELGLFKNSVATQINLPVFNAIGNHDNSKNSAYKNFFTSSTFYKFEFSKNLFIILDTELNHGSIIDKQYIFLKKALHKAVANSSIKNIFIFTHRLIWLTDNKEFKFYKSHVNSFPQQNNFKKDLLPLLKTAAKKKNLYWISGDLGLNPLGLANPIYEKDIHNITFIGTGIGDTKFDNILKVSVKEGSVDFEVISLVGNNMKPLSGYNVKFWKKESIKKSFNKLPWHVLWHRYFHAGAVIGFIISFIFLFIIFKIKTLFKETKL